MKISPKVMESSWICPGKVIELLVLMAMAAFSFVIVVHVVRHNHNHI